MSVVIGIDVGGSTTKIVGFTEQKELIAPLVVRATDPITSIYGAFGKFTDTNNLSIEQIDKVMVTGVGSSYISKPIYGLPCEHVPEFPSIGHGGLYLSKLKEAIVVSMGTGTAIIHATKDGNMDYLGGTGVGGGTIIGLSRRILGMSEIENIVTLAEQGDLDKVDLKVKDITRKDILPGMPRELTAANFGKLSELATKEDIALGLLNMVFETIGMLALFSARSHNINDIVLTGNLTTMPLAKKIIASLNEMFKVNFMIPESSQFGTVIGAALLADK